MNSISLLCSFPSGFGYPPCYIIALSRFLSFLQLLKTVITKGIHSMTLPLEGAKNFVRYRSCSMYKFRCTNRYPKTDFAKIPCFVCMRRILVSLCFYFHIYHINILIYSYLNLRLRTLDKKQTSLCSIQISPSVNLYVSSAKSMVSWPRCEQM